MPEADRVVYQFTANLYEPSEDTGWLFMAEVPELPGCRAWGESPHEVADYLHSVVVGFVQLYQEQGRPIPGDPLTHNSYPRPMQVYA